MINFPKVTKKFDISEVISTYKNICELIINYEINQWDQIYLQNLKQSNPSNEVIEMAISIRITNQLLNQNSFKRILARSTSANKKIYYPLPREWIKILQSQGYSVSRRVNSFLWSLFCIAQLLRDVIKELKLWRYLKNIEVTSQLKKSTYFYDLKKSNLDSKSHYTLVNWWKNKYPNTSITHSCYDIETGFIVTPLGSINLSNSLKVLGTVCKYFKDNKTYKFWFQFIQIYKYFKILIFPNCIIPKEFVLNSSRGSYIPIEIYAFIQKGLNVQYLFYALHSEPDHKNGKVNEINFWRMLNLPNLLLVDKIQKQELLQQCNSYQEIRIVGIPWYSDSPEIISNNETNLVSFFPSTSFISDEYRDNNLDEYWIFNEDMLFTIMNDISAIAKLLNFKILIKEKRSVDNFFMKIKNHVNWSNFISINSEVSPVKIIEKSSLVIAKPFSTISLLGKNMDKNTIEYVPNFEYVKDRYHKYRGIPLIYGANDLFEYINESLKLRR